MNLKYFNFIIVILSLSKSCHSLENFGPCTIKGSALECYGVKDKSQFPHVLMSLNNAGVKHVFIYNSSEEFVTGLFENADHLRIHKLEEVSIIESGLQQVPKPIIEILEESGQLKKLNLSSNSIVSVPSQILRSTKFMTVDLSGNNIGDIDQTTLNVPIMVYENPKLNCDWLESHFLTVANFSDHRRLICRSSSGIFNQMTPDQVASVLRTPICNECECYSCYQALTVNCSSKGLSNIPQSLPHDTKVVHLANNMIKELLFNETKNWNNVLYLFLNNNTVDNLSGFLTGQGSEILKNLVLLQLESNRLSSINSTLLNPKIERLFLKDNPWKCDCQLVDFRSWLEKHVDRVNEIDQIKCASSPIQSARNGINSFVSNDQNIENENAVIISLKRDQLCPELKEYVYEEDPIKNGILDSLSISLFILVRVYQTRATLLLSRSFCVYKAM